MLQEKIKLELLDTIKKLKDRGEIYSQDKLNGFIKTFQDKFSYEKLAALDGEDLLNFIHKISDKNSLDYWIEFKNDEEFPLIFGSIAGGSALKYGIYFNQQNGAWFKGSSTKQIELTIQQAIDFVTNQRDELLRGYKIIENLSVNASKEDYENLQKTLETAMPTIVDLGWCHKFLAICFPDKIDDYHNIDYQKYHLIKLLELPSSSLGRYVNAWYFVQIAKECGEPINTITTALNYRNGRPKKYWRIGTTSGKMEDRFELMKENSCVAVGWNTVNQDLADITKDADSKEKLKNILRTNYPGNTPQDIGRGCQQLFDFIASIEIDDIVVAMNGAKVKGIGRVTGGYYFEENAQHFRHRRSVKWLSLEEWKMDPNEGLRTTTHRFKKILEVILQIETKIQLPLIMPVLVPPPDYVLDPHIERIKTILERKGQIILYGPPGTGKTFWAKRAAYQLAALHNFSLNETELNDNQQNELKTNYIGFCCFHPGYGYEDFIESYRPVKETNMINYEIRPGIFKRFCEVAKEKPNKKFYLIIDEINRGDIPRIFGELISLLELDKRKESMTLPLSGEIFTVPENLFLIGTMNTADRSIALLDTALRRRFGFYELMPDYSILKNANIEDIPVENWLRVLNNRILSYLAQNGRNLQIGHSYLMDKGKPISDPQLFIKIFREDIIPLLEEYCYDDYDLLEKILGKELVDIKSKTIRKEIFDENNWDKIKQVISLNDPGMLQPPKDAPIVSEDESNDDEIDEGVEKLVT